MFCPWCRAQNSEDSRFCISCGKNLIDSVSPPPPTLQKPPQRILSNKSLALVFAIPMFFGILFAIYQVKKESSQKKQYQPPSSSKSQKKIPEEKTDTTEKAIIPEDYVNDCINNNQLKDIPGLEMAKYPDILKMACEKLPNPVLSRILITDFGYGEFGKDWKEKQEKRLISAQYEFTQSSSTDVELSYRGYLDAAGNMTDFEWKDSLKRTSSSHVPLPSPWKISYEEALEIAVKAAGLKETDLYIFQLGDLSVSTKGETYWDIDLQCKDKEKEKKVQINAQTGEVIYVGGWRDAPY